MLDVVASDDGDPRKPVGGNGVFGALHLGDRVVFGVRLIRELGTERQRAVAVVGPPHVVVAVEAAGAAIGIPRVHMHGGVGEIARSRLLGGCRVTRGEVVRRAEPQDVAADFREHPGALRGHAADAERRAVQRVVEARRGAVDDRRGAELQEAVGRGAERHAVFQHVGKLRGGDIGVRGVIGVGGVSGRGYRSAVVIVVVIDVHFPTRDVERLQAQVAGQERRVVVDLADIPAGDFGEGAELQAAFEHALDRREVGGRPTADAGEAGQLLVVLEHALEARDVRDVAVPVLQVADRVEVQAAVEQADDAGAAGQAHAAHVEREQRGVAHEPFFRILNVQVRTSLHLHVLDVARVRVADDGAPRLFGCGFVYGGAQAAVRHAEFEQAGLGAVELPPHVVVGEAAAQVLGAPYIYDGSEVVLFGFVVRLHSLRGAGEAVAVHQVAGRAEPFPGAGSFVFDVARVDTTPAAARVAAGGDGRVQARSLEDDPVADRQAVD